MNFRRRAIRAGSAFAQEAKTIERLGVGLHRGFALGPLAPLVDEERPDRPGE